MKPPQPAVEQARQRLLGEARRLTHGLERISADSRWARRSSGIRGALLRALDRFENDLEPDGRERETLEPLIAAGYDMLIKAAREIRGDQDFPA